MKKLRKWNRHKRQYQDYFIPDEWNVKTYSTNMQEVINCAQCGKEITFGESITSHEIHTEMGFGYSVCRECNGKEIERLREERKND